MERVFQALDLRLDRAAHGPIAVAYSGGSDSLALLLLAKAWADRAGRPVLALTVDHGLQPASATWTQGAAQTAQRLGVGFRALAWDGPKPSTGLPAAARLARHRLLAGAAREAGAGVILVGHTFDDQLENALMRGAGQRVGVLRPWSPSPVWSEGRGLFLCRPLLAERRAELKLWLAGRGWAWIDDPANDDPASPRARARAQIGAGGEADAPEAAQVDDASLATRCRVLPWGGIEISRAGLARQAGGLELLRIATACASGMQALPRPQRAAPLLARIATGERFAASLGGARVEAGVEVLIVREPGEFEREGVGHLLLQSGETGVWDGRFEIAALRGPLSVSPLRGRAARLAPEARALLQAIPSAGRGGLPAVLEAGLPPSCPALEASAQGAATVACLVQARFDGARGLIRTERESSFAMLMAHSRGPSYVSSGAKGLTE